MHTRKSTAVESKKAESKPNIVARVEFMVRASLREECVEADFVHSILGRIFAKPEECGDDEEAGYIRASLVQFGEAMDHGIGSERLGDGIEASIAEYWERRFDLNTGYWKLTSKSSASFVSARGEQSVAS